jgi:hypothetical protein
MENENIYQPIEKQTNVLEDITKENPLNNLAANLKLGESNLDMASIMSMASTLLTNDSVLNSLKGMGSLDQLNTVPVVKTQPKQKNTDLTLFHELIDKIQLQIMSEMNAVRERLEKLTNEMIAIKFELNESRKLSQNLQDLISNSQIEKGKRKKNHD